LLWPPRPKQKNECAIGDSSIADNGKVHRKNFCDYSKEIGLLDTTTGDANPRACFSQRNLAKEKYYPKGIAFLQKQKPEQVSASMIEAALAKLGDGFKGLPVAARLRIIKGVLANVRINKDYSITLSVKNPNLLDLEKSETSVIMGAIGLPKEINGSEGGTKKPDPF
jgi:hypothetical protein